MQNSSEYMVLKWRLDTFIEVNLAPNALCSRYRFVELRAVPNTTRLNKLARNCHIVHRAVHRLLPSNYSSVIMPANSNNADLQRLQPHDTYYIMGGDLHFLVSDYEQNVGFVSPNMPHR